MAVAAFFLRGGSSLDQAEPQSTEEAVLKKRAMVLALALLSGAALASPASARLRMDPVDPQDLNHFVGMELHGMAFADLGVIGQVDRRAGLVALNGKHGEFAVLHTSLLRH